NGPRSSAFGDRRKAGQRRIKWRGDSGGEIDGVQGVERLLETLFFIEVDNLAADLGEALHGKEQIIGNGVAVAVNKFLVRDVVFQNSLLRWGDAVGDAQAAMRR